MKLHYLLLAILNVLVTGDDSEVEHYVNLINEEIARSENFTLLTDASSYETTNRRPRGINNTELISNFIE